ncbi:MAG: hypothetical protein EOO88_14520, partial [Pedobacter sp.]
MPLPLLAPQQALAMVSPTHLEEGCLQYDLHESHAVPDVRNLENKGKVSFVFIERWKTEEDLKIAQQWSFDRLQDYLFESQIISDPGWLDNYLRPEFKKAMIHLIRMSQYSFLRQSPLFELFGVDFMLDSDLNLWFIECNTSPVLKGTSDEKERFVSKMLRDQFEIVIGLLRSRMKRVLVFVNQITAELKVVGATYDTI